MAVQLDFAPIFTSTGSLLQSEYAQKAAEKGPTIIASKNKNGIVIASEKPIEDRFDEHMENHNIHMLTENISIAYSGSMSDGIHFKKHLQDTIINNIDIYDENITGEKLRKSCLEYFTTYSRMWNTRPSGINNISAIYDGEYRLYHTDTSGLSKSYSAVAIGKGTSRAKTELELLDFHNLEMKEMVRQAVRILFKSYDMRTDKEFNFESAVISAETENKFYRLKEEDYAEYVAEFEDLCAED